MDKKSAPEVAVMPIDMGIDEKARKAIAQGLSQLLADTYTLYLKTHNFHWNVTGPMFQDPAHDVRATIQRNCRLR